jgi:hypothetical protein
MQHKRPAIDFDPKSLYRATLVRGERKKRSTSDRLEECGQRRLMSISSFWKTGSPLARLNAPLGFSRGMFHQGSRQT